MDIHETSTLHEPWLPPRRRRMFTTLSEERTHSGGGGLPLLEQDYNDSA